MKSEFSKSLKLPKKITKKQGRWLLGLSMLGAIAGQLIATYKSGKTPKVPEPPLEVLAAVAGTVTGANMGSKSKQLTMPDALMMLFNYGLTTWLARGGNQSRNKLAPVMPIAMGVKTIADSAVAFKMAQEEWKEKKEVCAYCQTAMVTAVASAIVAVPEMVKAIRVLVNGEDQAYATSDENRKTKKRQTARLAAG